MDPIAFGNDKQQLTELNLKIAEMEQQRDKAAQKFFHDILSDQLVFRRANGKVVDKTAFSAGLREPDPFVSRQAEDIDISSLDGRALVVLVVRTTKQDGTKSRYRNIRLFSKQGTEWRLELWYNYELPVS